MVKCLWFCHDNQKKINRQKCLINWHTIFTYTAAKDLQNYIDIETNWYEVEI